MADFEARPEARESHAWTLGIKDSDVVASSGHAALLTADHKEDELQQRKW